MDSLCIKQVAKVIYKQLNGKTSKEWATPYFQAITQLDEVIVRSGARPSKFFLNNFRDGWSGPCKNIYIFFLTKKNNNK